MRLRRSGWIGEARIQVHGVDASGSYVVSNPAVHFGISGAGPRSWFGWPDIPQLETLVSDWAAATNEAKRQQLADEMQRVALNEVPYVPWGQWLQPTAYRKSVRGVLKFAAPVFWNVKIT
jgi:peptide/nickel transport system substrate-binding protein